jgi:hypothetical protein
MKNVVTIDDQRQFHAQFQLLVKGLDRQIDDPQGGREILLSIPWYSIVTPYENSLGRFPSFAGLIPWRIEYGKDKESKMPMTLEPPPSAEKIQKFRETANRFLDKLKLPSLIELPRDEELEEPSDRKYYAGGQILEDKIDHPERHGRFLYQAFMTGWDSPRECWLPSKEYKVISKFWYYIGKSLLEYVEYDVSGKRDTDIKDIISSRWRQCKSLDIKGFGLLFPREYIYQIVDLLVERYPDLKEYGDRTKGIINSIEVEYKDEIFIPKRGVGLGYFHPLMNLAIFAMLQDAYVVGSFADDTLIDSNDYDRSVEILESYEIRVNYDKSGEEWYNLCYFIGAMLDPDDDCLRELTNENAGIAACFNTRWHWSRKNICATLFPEEQFTVAYCLERIFGFEFYRGESQSHLNDGGYLTAIPEKFGVSRSKYACSQVALKSGPKGFLPQEYLDGLTFEECKEIHQTRKERWNSKRLLECFEDNTVVQPDPEAGRYACEYPIRYTQWAEDTVREFGLTSHRTTFGLSIDELYRALYKYGACPNPIESFINQDTLLPHRPKSVSDEMREILYKSAACREIEKRYAWKRSDLEIEPDTISTNYSQSDIPPLTTYLAAPLPDTKNEVTPEDVTEKRTDENLDVDELGSICSDLIEDLEGDISDSDCEEASSSGSTTS